MKHIKIFEAIRSKMNESINGGNMSIELPEGYMFDLFNLDDEADCRRHFEEGDIENWSGMSFEEWLETAEQTGVMNYPNGNKYYRGFIDWEEMGIFYMYEIHPI